MGMSTIHDEAPQELRAAFQQDLPPAGFSLEDVLAGGRRRRRRRQAAQVAGGAFAVAALAGIAVTGVRGLEPRVVPVAAPAGHRSSTGTAPAVPPAPAPEPGCSAQPATCTAVLRDWLDGHGMALPAAGRFHKDANQNGVRWEKGTWRFYGAVDRAGDPLHAVELGVTLAPSTTAPVGNTVSWDGFDGHDVSLPDGETARAYVSRSSGETALAAWLVPAREGVHPALKVEVFVVDKGGTATVPRAFDDASVAGLVSALL